MPKPKKTTAPSDGAGDVHQRLPTNAPPVLSHDAIARRAYELFVQDGAEHGRDQEHWRRAEQKLLNGIELRQAS